MIKVAIFVEGYTEQQFIVQLLLAMAGKKGITFEINYQFEGELHHSEFISEGAGNDIYILLVNCRNDSQVKSQIANRHASLTMGGYSKIIGIRDVYPHAIEDLPEVQTYALEGLPSGGSPIDIILAVMEVEAWFLEELSHYNRLDSEMTVARIQEKGFDLISKRGHEWPQPAQTLHAIYSHWKKAYKKKENQINRTINALDLDEIYVTVRNNAPSLNELICSLEQSIFV